jgi:hypothetical protein
VSDGNENKTSFRVSSQEVCFLGLEYITSIKIHHYTNVEDQNLQSSISIKAN